MFARLQEVTSRSRGGCAMKITPKGNLMLEQTASLKHTAKKTFNHIFIKYI